MLARVKQDYAAGSVMAFSGREYVRSEWREVPAGFEEQAQGHPLLDTQFSLEEIRATSAGLPGLGKIKTEAPVTVETAAPPAAEPPAPDPQPEPEAEPKTSRRRRRTGTEE